MPALPSALPVSLVFAAALLLWLSVRLWLATRQMRHVARHRDAVPLPFAATISLSSHQRAADYTLAKGRLGLLSMAWSAALLLAWTLLGGLDGLNTLIRTAVQPRFGDMAYQLALLTAFTFIGSLLELPFALYSTFGLEQRFGFNRMTWRLYLADALRSTLVGLLIGLPLAAGALWLMGRMGGSWWVWAWAAWVSIQLLAMVIYPTVIAPLFNKFEPLADGALKERVQALMARCGFQAKGLFVMDGSKRSAHGNAYFTGLGSAKRVVFFDTLLDKLDPIEVEAVLAHELGHFKRRHVTKRLVIMMALGGVALAVLGWLSAQPNFYLGLGVRPNLGAPNDALALLLFLSVVPVFGFFLSPFLAHGMRRDEFEADAYACAQSDGQALASALVKLYQDNAATLTPDPLYVRVYYSHPPASERLAAMRAIGQQPAGAA